jgi:hypothetical protein
MTVVIPDGSGYRPHIAAYITRARSIIIPNTEKWASQCEEEASERARRSRNTMDDYINSQVVILINYHIKKTTFVRLQKSDINRLRTLFFCSLRFDKFDDCDNMSALTHLATLNKLHVEKRFIELLWTVHEHETFHRQFRVDLKIKLKIRATTCIWISICVNLLKPYCFQWHWLLLLDGALEWMTFFPSLKYSRNSCRFVLGMYCYCSNLSQHCSEKVTDRLLPQKHVLFFGRVC